MACCSSWRTDEGVNLDIQYYYIVGLVYNYCNSLSKKITGDSKNVLETEKSVISVEIIPKMHKNQRMSFDNDILVFEFIVLISLNEKVTCDSCTSQNRLWSTHT